MKRITLLLLVVVLAFSVSAQDVNTPEKLVSKKGFPILPEAGDFSLGIDATPFFTYAGQLLGGNAAFAPTFTWTAANPMRISGKMMINEHTAYRVAFRLGMSNNKNSAYKQQDGQTDPLVRVEDTWSKSQMNVGLGAGLEKSRGNGRLQGIYGAMAMLSIGTDKDTYEYGNAYSSTNMTPNRKDFNGNDLGSAWVMEIKKGTAFGFEAIAFVGVEYFFAPKLSISGEFSYGLGFSSIGDGNATIQSWDFANSAVKTSTTSTGGASNFTLDTRATGVLNLNFYF
ncbi:MAG: hypothetical protein DRI86_09745 [Bacteroidetes bacterium]|nr:MAG: hypothetical protein DRI86_09745 [Bacteroidota bacterium]